MSTRLHADLHAPALARSFVADQAARWELEVAVPDLLLVVSELVTNSVRAGSSQVDVILDAAAGTVELSVGDDAAGLPTPREAHPDALGGRGLQIVAEVADAWTTTPYGSARGKRVTASWRPRTSGHFPDR